MSFIYRISGLEWSLFHLHHPPFREAFDLGAISAQAFEWSARWLFTTAWSYQFCRVHLAVALRRHLPWPPLCLHQFYQAPLAQWWPSSGSRLDLTHSTIRRHLRSLASSLKSLSRGCERKNVCFGWDCLGHHGCQVRPSILAGLSGFAVFPLLLASFRQLGSFLFLKSHFLGELIARGILRIICFLNWVKSLCLASKKYRCSLGISEL